MNTDRRELGWTGLLLDLEAGVAALARRDWAGGAPVLALGAVLLSLILMGGWVGSALGESRARSQLERVGQETARQHLRILILEIERLRAALPLVADANRSLLQSHALTELPAGIATLSLKKDLRVAREELQKVAGRLGQRKSADKAAPNDRESIELGKRLEATRAYLMNACGEVISLNIEGGKEDFIGGQFENRSYFQELEARNEAQSYNVGRATGVPGIFLSRRVELVGTEGRQCRSDKPPNQYLAKSYGAAVFKLEFGVLRELWRGAQGQTKAGAPAAYLTAAVDGKEDRVIRIASNKEWECKREDNLQKCVWPFEEIGGSGPISRLVRVRAIDEGENSKTKDAQQKHEPVYLAVSLPIGNETEFATLTALGFSKMHVLQPTDLMDSARAIGFWTGASTTMLVSLLGTTLLFWAASQRRKALLAQKAIIEEANRKLTTANRIAVMGQTAAEVAHEVAQPASTIQLRADLAFSEICEARNKVTDDTPVAPHLDRARAALERVLAMGARIEDILRRWRERTVTERSPMSICLASAILNSIALAELRMSRPDVEIKSAPIPTIRVCADPVGLDQILVNLITNAIEAMQDTFDARIEIEAVEGEGWVEIFVRDNGPGIAPGLKEEIFERWTTSKEFGVGIGLAIARDIAQSFGGDLRAEEAQGGGAQFVVRLIKAGT